MDGAWWSEAARRPHGEKLGLNALKYRGLFGIDPGPLTVFDALQTPCVRPVAEAFKANLERIGSVVLNPPGLVMLTATYEQEMAEAALIVLGRSRPTRADFGDEAVRDRFVAEFVRLREDRARTERQEEGRDSPNSLNDAMSRLDSVLTMSNGDVLYDGLRAIIASVPVAAWTAIETMVGDLWEAAVNVGGKGLWELRGKPKRIDRIARGKTSGERIDCDGSPNDGERRGGDHDRKIPVTRLRMVTRDTLDLSGKMGTLLREDMNFTRLDGMREAYSRAFAHRPEKIDTVLGERTFDALSVLRNVLVHRGGVADREYQDRVKSLDVLPKVSSGHVIDVDGELVGRVAGQAVGSGKRLILAVDEWLAEHGSQSKRDRSEAGRVEH